ncbi:MAG TPA: DUF6636 domain-containing protein [Mycobacterium sp.]|jgi:hypothetical protein
MHMPRILAVLAMAAAAMPLSAVAQALSFEQFQSPSGNIFCGMGITDGGNGVAECEIVNRNWAAPQQPADCPLSFGDRIGIQQGEPARFGCHGDTLRGIGFPTLAYGHSRSAGAITCSSDPSGMTCTDNGTGHFFKISRESYELG